MLPHLETERLVLRPIGPEDVDAWHADGARCELRWS